MNYQQLFKAWTMGGCALAALSAASAAQAQAPASDQLQEIVVTATRQSESINRVPLSISAQTQRNLDQQGIRQFSDLVSTIPSLSLNQTTAGVANVAVRGIQNNAGTNTAPTTGFYLDDTPLQKRNSAGFANGNGTPLPPLFDLERVEVLRGPQGTLFGGSSEGGTVRYITPTPSLTRYSMYARAELSSTNDGDASYDGGVAIGGPIIQDKLGFRASVYAKHTGGYIDFIDPFTGAERMKNVNSGETRMARFALAWAPTDRSRITLAYFTSTERSDNNGNTFTVDNIKTPIVEAPVCVNTNTLTAATRSFPPTVPCTAPNTFQRAGGTFGPYNLEPYDLVTNFGLGPSKTITQIPTLTIDYDFGPVVAKSITSYIADENNVNSQSQGNEFNQRAGSFSYAGAPGGTFTRGLPFSYAARTFGADGPPYYGYADVTNSRDGISQEVRFTSPANQRPFSWVAGVFFSNMRVTSHWRGTYGNRLTQDLYGVNVETLRGVPLLNDAKTGLPILYIQQNYNSKDTEVAGFVEANYWVVPDKLRLTAGVRASHATFQFHGEVFAGSTGVTDANRLIRDGSITEDPVTPKVGAQYFFTSDDMVYVTASKGFRTGGVNPIPPPATCNAVFGRFGLSVNDVPATYNSDSVWSYEAGGKFRLFDNRVQLNGDVYRIDWSNIQTPVNFAGCGTQYVINSGSARSQGFELEAQARLFSGFTGNVAVGYVDAKNLTSFFLPAAPGFTPTLATAEGQKFSVPPWTVNVGGRYEIPFGADAKVYARGDWRWSSSYKGSPPPGVQGFTPATYDGVALSRINIRAGIEYRDFDINLFVNNLTNAHDGNVTGGVGGCPATGGSTCVGATTYTPYYTTSGGTPRQIGVQIAFRH